MARAKLQAFQEKECTTSTYCKALAHPARIIIFNLLSEHGVATFTEIKGSVPLHQSTMMQHLEMMHRANLIQHAPHTSGVTGYRLRAAAVIEMKDYLEEVIGELRA